jgi:hypothetical protein
MRHDPLYRQIAEKLSAELDPKLFEQCVCDLLGKDGVKVVPIPGGQDAGMDGAVFDGEAEAFPLICTTQGSVITNLTKSLDSYLKGGGTRRKAILATSRHLTARERRNLENRAREKGFNLVQVYSQEALADLLYRDPRWTRELLGLTGQPPALSALPLISRPQRNMKMIGREEDLAWLENTRGDRLLVGQPGSGKTFLLQEIVRRQEALFVVSGDLNEIAASLRECRPGVIIVDDAHVCPDLIQQLGHLRRQLGAEYSILATAWPTYRDKLAGILHLPESQMRELELLTRDQIVDVVKDAGIAGLVALVAQIVDQAQGCPGLAVTLADLCLTGGVPDVSRGDALLRNIRTSFRDVVGDKAFDVLAHFAIGGRRGMRMQDVARLVGTPDIDLRQDLSKLAAAGVIEDLRDCIRVQPRQLRWVLVRDTFFKGPGKLDVGPVLRQSPDPKESALVLVGARHAGAAIPDDVLLEMLERASSSEAWEGFAWLGRAEARTLLERHPDIALERPRPGLQFVPELVIPLYLKAHTETSRDASLSSPDDVLRPIEDWVMEARPGTSGVLRRRKAVLDAVLSWLEQGNDTRAGLGGLTIALTPEFRSNEIDPGSGMSWTMRHGYITPSDVKDVSAFWTKCTPVIRSSRIEDWKPLVSLVRAWASPRPIDGRETRKLNLTMRKIARTMLRDLAEMVHDHPGFVHAIRSLAADLRMKVSLHLDPDFDTVCPKSPGLEWRAAEKTLAEKARELGRRWASTSPRPTAERIAHFEREADLADIRWPRMLPVVCEEIAAKALRPRTWLKALLSKKVAPNLVFPFLRRIVAERKRGWQSDLLRCLDAPLYRFTVLQFCLCGQAVPSETLIDAVLARIGEDPNLIGGFTTRFNDVPENIMNQLLTHRNLAVVENAVVGEFHVFPKRPVRAGIQKTWRDAVLRCAGTTNHFKEIFEGDATLAFDWLLARLESDPDAVCRYSEIVPDVIKGLSLPQRRDLLARLPADYVWEESLQALVAEPELYGEFLEDPKWGCWHLVPLRGRPNGNWVEKARLALSAGYRPHEVARAAYHTYWGWSGHESSMWKEWEDAFRALPGSDPNMAAVIEEGAGMAQSRRQTALAREKHEATYGRF